MEKDWWELQAFVSVYELGKLLGWAIKQVVLFHTDEKRTTLPPKIMFRYFLYHTLFVQLPEEIRRGNKIFLITS